MILYVLFTTLALFFPVRCAKRFGTLTLQQMHLPSGLGWHCSLRWAGEGPRYSWTSSGRFLRTTIAAVACDAYANPIKTIEGKPFAPKLGGAEFDE